MTVYDQFQKGPVTRFIRNGDTVHLWGCPYAGERWVRWNWAIGKSLSEIEDACSDWMRPCGHCRKKVDWA